MPTGKTGKRRTGSNRAWKKFWHSGEKYHKVLKFLIKFNLFAIPLYILLLLNLQWSGLQVFIADLVYNLLHLMGIMATRTAEFISIPILNGQWGAFINWDCTGWKSFLALFALVMSTDFRMDRKIKGLAVMLPALFAVNILRIVFMFYFVHVFDLAYFDFVHAVVWSWGLIITILVFWVIWMKFYARNS